LIDETRRMGGGHLRRGPEPPAAHLTICLRGGTEKSRAWSRAFDGS
jgi:hypothetical protein